MIPVLILIFLAALVIAVFGPMIIMQNREANRLEARRREIDKQWSEAVLRYWFRDGQ